MILRTIVSIVSYANGIIFMVSLLVFNYSTIAEADKVWLNNGTILEGELKEITVPGKVIMNLSWSESPVTIFAEHIRRIEIMPRRTNILPNFMIGLTNEIVFPCKLNSIEKENLKITTMDMQERTIPLVQVAFFSSLSPSTCIFKGISNRWDFSKWEIQKDAWMVSERGLQTNPFYNKNQALILSLPERKTKTLLRFKELRGGTFLLGRRKLADGYDYIKLCAELHEYPGYVSIFSQTSDRTAVSSACYLPYENIDLWIIHNDDSVEFFFEGVKILSCKLPPEYGPVIGFSETCDFLLYEMSIYSGTPLIKMNNVESGSGTRILLTNKDVLSAQSLSFHNNTVSLEVYGNQIKIPVEKISMVCFPRPINKELEYSAEILMHGFVRSWGERIVGLKNGCLIVEDKNAVPYSIPCTEPVSIFLSSDSTVTGAKKTLKLFADAIIKKDVCMLNDIGILSADLIASIFTEGMTENIKKFEIVPLNEALLGKQAHTEINIKTQIENNAEDIEKAILFIFRSKGRWYVFIPEQ